MRYLGNESETAKTGFKHGATTSVECMPSRLNSKGTRYYVRGAKMFATVIIPIDNLIIQQLLSSSYREK